MKLTSLFKASILLVSLPLLAVGQQSKITCRISTDKSIYKVGETPVFTVTIRNDGDSTIQLVKILDASDVQWRYPYSYYEVSSLPLPKNGHKPAKARDLMVRCGNMDGIGPNDFVNDFVAIAPGQGFNPYQAQSEEYTGGSVPGAYLFSKKGRYRVLYHYATNEPDFRKWMGDMTTSWFDLETGQVNPDKQEQYARLTALFARVPKLSLVSNELILAFD